MFLTFSSDSWKQLSMAGVENNSYNIWKVEETPWNTSVVKPFFVKYQTVGSCQIFSSEFPCFSECL